MIAVFRPSIRIFGVAAVGLGVAFGALAAGPARAVVVEPVAKPVAGRDAPAQTPAADLPHTVKKKSASKQDSTDEPINIASDILTVEQAKNVAVFEGKVDAAQGSMRLRADRLEVYYEENGPEGEGTRSITQMKAFGSVVFVTAAETAQGDRGVYNVRNKTIWLEDNVVLSQGGNVLRGTRLDMDLASGKSTLKSDRRDQRVVGRFVPNSDDRDAPDDGAAVTEGATSSVGN